MGGVIFAPSSLSCTFLTSRLSIQQLQLVRGPYWILLTAQELTFIHRPRADGWVGQAPGWVGSGRQSRSRVLTTPSGGCAWTVQVNQEVSQTAGA